MALQNIGASNADDAFYRYKMPRLVAKIEGRGNGIRTNVVNMVEVAKALARPPSYTTKFFGCELGAQSKFDEKTGTSIVNGAHDTPKLASLLEGFIKKFVQCYSCGNPETDVIFDKRDNVQLKCKACGFVSEVDMRHKLVTFILKNRPETKPSKKDKQLRRAERERLKAGEAVDEEERKRAKETRRKKKEDKKKPTDLEDDKQLPREDSPAGSEDQDAQDGDEEDEVEWQTDTSAAAVEARMQEQLTSATAALVTAGNGEPAAESSPRPNGHSNGATKKSVVPHSPTSLEPLTPKPKTPSVVEPTPEPKKSPKHEIVEALEELNVHGSLVQHLSSFMLNHDAAATADFLQGRSEPLPQKGAALVEVVFGSYKGLDDCKKMAEVVCQQKAVLRKFAAADVDAQAALLAGLELFCVTVPAAKKESPLVLKAFYDQDVVEEEVILAWYDAGPKLNKDLGISEQEGAAVRKFNVRLVEWLRTAEEDSD